MPVTGWSASEKYCPRVLPLITIQRPRCLNFKQGTPKFLEKSTRAPGGLAIDWIRRVKEPIYLI